MPQSPGQLAEASHYNAVAEVVNKIFGDQYRSTATVTDANRVATHKFGWGAFHVADNLPTGTLITALRLQDLVDRTNVSKDRTPLSDTLLVFSVPTNRTDVTANTPIRAEDLNVVDSNLQPLFLNNNHLAVDPTNASALTATPNNGPYTRTTSWTNKLNGEHRWLFDNYNHARYFFNSGGQLRLRLNMSGGSTAGYYNWSDVINEMGMLNFTWDNVFESAASTGGTSEGKGFYDLTEYYGDGTDAGTADEGLLYTSSGVTLSGYGYGYGYGYGTGAFGYITTPGTPTAYSGVFTSSLSQYSAYQNLKFKLYGKWANNGAEVHFKMVLDDTTFDQVIDGTLSTSLSLLMPDIVTNGNATFDVSPIPTVRITNSWNSADDS